MHYLLDGKPDLKMLVAAAEYDAEIRRDLRNALPEDMRDTFDEFVEGMDSELEEVRAVRDEFEAELEKRDAEAFDVLRSVRDWFDNVILLGRPMQDPRAVWKQVERALEQ